MFSLSSQPAPHSLFLYTAKAHSATAILIEISHKLIHSKASYLTYHQVHICVCLI